MRRRSMGNCSLREAIRATTKVWRIAVDTGMLAKDESTAVVVRRIPFRLHCVAGIAVAEPRESQSQYQ